MMNKLKEQCLMSIDEIIFSIRNGSNRKAFEELNRFNEHISRYIILLSDSSPKQDKISAINDFLGELLLAIENKDYVYMCDILRYGIKPQIAA